MQAEVNYDESKVPEYALPDPLVCANGERVADAPTWWEVRRPELLSLFVQEMYGQIPPRPVDLSFQPYDRSEKVLGGIATRKQVELYFTDSSTGPKLDLLIYQPVNCQGPFPVFFGLNFFGNHTINPDMGITLSDGWFPNFDPIIVDNKPTQASRGVGASRWPVERILERGYALATAYYGDLDPDFDDGFQNGVHALFARRGSNAWGSISAWAWGISRVLDYFETDSELDSKKVVVMGHSRLGKTALWAGACDARIAIIISNDSGCGGAALSRRCFGETVAAINMRFPHWFCDNFKHYSHNESELPFDQHMLISLIAPRPVYVASAVEDLWSDPRGEYLSAFHASPVYRLLGKEGLLSPEMPALSHPVMTSIGYHIRPGNHDVTVYDWDQFMEFADMHISR